jgi:hypothetical protein
MKPAPEACLSLAAVIRKDIASLREMTSEIAAILRDWRALSATYSGRAGLGFALHNLYNALENSFDQISRTFENHVVDDSRWHAELLNKMLLEIPGLRPAVMPVQLADLLNDLRGFRHVFRHSYSYQLDPVKLSNLASRWQRDEASLIAALERFNAYLAGTQPRLFIKADSK